MTDEQKRDKAIEVVLREFDFDNVHKAMVATDWKWGTNNTRTEISTPTRDELVACARDLLEKAWERKGTWRTGGFQATYIGPDETEGQGDYAGELSLAFWIARSYVELTDISLII